MQSAHSTRRTVVVGIQRLAVDGAARRFGVQEIRNFLFFPEKKKKNKPYWNWAFIDVKNQIK